MTQGSDSYVCPSCRTPLAKTTTGWNCPTDSYDFGTTEEIPDFILPSRRADVDEFLNYYGQVRKAESWGSPQIEYYLELPFRDITERYPFLWKVRAKTYRAFIDDLKSAYPNGSAKILDVGAGNCWLSYRLARQGYNVMAADINLDSTDGLLVAQKLMQNGSARFRCVRSEFDFLPFPERSFDVIVFNASLHYSSDPVQTVQRTLPLLSTQGTIYIFDSPLYHDPESGKAMVRERIAYYHSRFGIQPPAKPVQSYLTFSQIEEIRAFADLTTREPNYGFFWRMRPWLALLFQRRELARFLLLKINRR